MALELVTQSADRYREPRDRGRQRARRGLWWLLVSLACALPLPGSPPAYAQPSEQSYNYTTNQGGISVEQAAATVRRETGGRVLSANPVRKGGERGVEVRVLIDGKRVKQYYVDSEGRLSPQ